MKQHKERQSTRLIELGNATRTWLRSPEGLVVLASAWRTGLYILRTQGTFVDTINHYKELKEGGFCIGVDILETGDVLENHTTYCTEPPEPLSPEEEHQLRDKEQKEEELLAMNEEARIEYINSRDMEQRGGSPDFVIRFYLAFERKDSVRDHFEALPHDAKSLVLESMWGAVEKYEAIRSDQAINRYSERCGTEGESVSKTRCCFIWEDVDYGYDPVYQPEGEETVYPCATLGYEFEILNDPRRVADVAGNTFSDIRNIIQTYRPSIDSAEVDKNPNVKNRLFTGSSTKLWEEKLTTYLLSQGFLVSLEPDLYIPEQSHEPRRTPDLMVIHKGRVIMIEIDSRYHLTKETKRKDGTRMTEANVEKYKRDRAFDRYMLCHGIPVLRVWYDEVDRNPEQVMTQILQIYDSIGGDRFTYR
jgi:hypothetical protein